MVRVDEISPKEYAPFYAGYIAKVPDVTLRSALDESVAALLDYLTHVTEDRVDYAYAPGKWTIKECLQHIIDTERIFAYRALAIARGDKTSLPGFDQDDYMRTVALEHRSYRKMIEEFRLLRQSNAVMFKTFTKEDLGRTGTMSDTPISVRALGFIMSGHVFHHAQLYREKYG